jgi:cobalt/nickel transport system permease protein
MLASAPDGKPLYAPYPLSIAVPVMAIEHLLAFGLIEGVVTAMILKYFVKHESDLVYATREA